MIGFYKFIWDFKGDKLVLFKVFVELCIIRQIIMVIKMVICQKYILFNFYVLLDKLIYDEEFDCMLFDVICGIQVSDLEEFIINQEEFVGLEDKMLEILSDLE